MAEVSVPTKADAIALLARRLRERYGDRLRQLFLLKDDPYEPTEDFGIDLVAVFADDSYDYFETVREVVHLAERVNAEVDYAFASAVHSVSLSAYEQGHSRAARIAKEEGVSLL